MSEEKQEGKLKPCKICGSSEPHEHSGFGKWSNNEGLLKQRILEYVMEDSWDDGEGGGYTTNKFEVSKILDAAQKEWQEQEYKTVESPQEYISLLQTWYQKWFGSAEVETE